MTPTLAGLIVIVFTFGGALIGRRLRRVLPSDHLSDDSKDTIKLGFGLVATMAALVLGLVTASAKTSFDTMDLGVRNAAMDVLTLDRLLARYGPETAEIRVGLKRAVAQRVEAIWPEHVSGEPRIDPSKGMWNAEGLVEQIEGLEPRDDRQRSIQTRADELAERLLLVRWLYTTAVEPSVPMLFLQVLLGWMTVTFVCYGLLAPPNLTVSTALLMCSASVGSAVFLILEMDGPFDGALRVSPNQLLHALQNMGG